MQFSSRLAPPCCKVLLKSCAKPQLEPAIYGVIVVGEPEMEEAATRKVIIEKPPWLAKEKENEVNGRKDTL